MTQPKGFGKNYFTLAAIQAYSAHTTLQRITTAIESRHLVFSCEDDSEDALEDDLLLETSFLAQSLQSASHCSCYYKARTRCKIKSHSTQKYSLNTIQALNPSNSPPLSMNSYFTCKKIDFKNRNIL